MSLYYKKKMPYTSYQEKHRRYYEAHRDSIAEKERQKKRWLDYYERNKEEIKRRRDLRKRNILDGTMVTSADAGDEGILTMWLPYPPNIFNS